MPKKAKAVIEYRNYDLSVEPILILTGEKWTISDIPSNNLHFHNCLEIGLCEKESGTIKLANSAFSFNEGDITIIGTDICHTTFSSPGTRSKWSYIFLDFDEILSSTIPIKSFINVSEYENLIHNCCGRLSSKDYPEIYGLVTAIINVMQQKKPSYRFEAFGLVIALLIELLNTDLSSNSGDGKIYNTSSQKTFTISPALNYIQKNYMNSFSIDDLAALCNMSPTHFRRSFSQIMNINPLTHITNVRITKATMLLRTTEKSILEISEDVGFRSVSSFNRHFIKLMGVAPLKWKHKNNFVHNRDIKKYSGWMFPPDQNTF